MTVREEQLEAIREAVGKLELRGLRFQFDQEKISEFMAAGQRTASADRRG
jgi:hypothetical protein